MKYLKTKALTGLEYLVAIDLNLIVGGEAGQGVQLVGYLLAKAFARAGYHVFADQDYESRIRAATISSVSG
jgi:Pyruvate/2-oxoacid:ferredoxin oxidoreductase gamma subunit